MRTQHTLLIIMMLSLFMFVACGGQSQPPVPPPETADRGERVETSASAPEPAPVAAADQAFTIVMLGDSLTAGFGLSADEALPEQIGVLLEARGLDVAVINAGVSGDTSAGGLARYDWSVASANPDLLILALGANDFLNRIRPASTKANLQAIISRAQGEGIAVVLAGVSTGDTAVANPDSAEYVAIYPDLAAEFGVPLFEDMLGSVRGKPSLIQLDGLHPTREGVKIMAGRMVAFLEPYLPEENPEETKDQ